MNCCSGTRATRTPQGAAVGEAKVLVPRALSSEQFLSVTQTACLALSVVSLPEVEGVRGGTSFMPATSCHPTFEGERAVCVYCKQPELAAAAVV